MHLKLLRARLDVLCLQCMLEEGHPLYDPVALAAVKAGAPQPKKPDPKPKVVPKLKKTTRKRTADGQPVDPQPDEPEEDGEDDDFSCDEP